MKQSTLADFGIIIAQPQPRLAEAAMLSVSMQPKECFSISENYVVHPLLKSQTVQYREFQLNLAAAAVQCSTLIVLPTGLGKTVIAAMVAADVKMHRGGQVVFLAPTKPLAHQHMQSFSKLLNTQDGMELFTGSMSVAKRARLWSQTSFIFATPQGIENDLERGKYTLENVSLLIFDEAHRAVGDYSYVNISKYYRTQARMPLVLGLTASPGAETERIEEVVANLGIERIEARGPRDEDVVNYVKQIDIVWSKLQLTPMMLKMRDALEKSLTVRINKLKRTGFLRRWRKGQKVPKKEIIQVGNAIRARFASRRSGMLFGAMFNQAVALQLCHCLELLETQGLVPLRIYLERMRGSEKLSKTEKAFLNEPSVVRALALCAKHRGSSHPKEDRLVEILREQLAENPGSLIIIFAQFRDTISTIIERLRSEGLNPVRFVGQANRSGGKGISQKEQAIILDRFRRREFNIMVASSVAEEGLDIPAVDLVVFYEPVPSEIRTIQRRGRTGRSAVGKVAVLVTEDSRDEAFLYAEIAREKKMRKLVKRMGRRRKEVEKTAQVKVKDSMNVSRGIS